MAHNAGEPFSMAGEWAPIPGCTSSRKMWELSSATVTRFSLSEGTDISAESSPARRLEIVVAGNLLASIPGTPEPLRAPRLSVVSLPADAPVGIGCGDDGCVYLEVSVANGGDMGAFPEAGRVLSLADEVPYREGEVVSKDVVNTDSVKLAVMSFDEGTGLDEHSAPGDAIVLALEGEGLIGYEGAVHRLRAGEAIRFAKGGRHYVKASSRFKMALLLTRE